MQFIPGSRGLAGFTLIELLVVIAIIASLLKGLDYEEAFFLTEAMPKLAL